MKRIKKIVLALILCIFISNTSLASSYVMHTVKPGDTFFNISRQYNVSLSTVSSLNSYVDADNVQIGQLLKVKPLSQNRTISIVVNGSTVNPDANPYIENNRTFVPIRFVADGLSADISWNQGTKTATVKHKGHIIDLPIGSNYAYVDGKAHLLDAPIQAYEGRTFIPIRFISETLGCQVNWNQSTYTVSINDGSVINTSYTSEDLYWLSRIVEAEASGEPYAGKLAVANIVLNRKDSSEFPNTIKGVVFDSNYGIQFTPIKDGTIYNTPSQESVNAARDALNGNNNIGSSLYFLNPDKSTSSWITSNRTFYTRISNHYFYL